MSNFKKEINEFKEMLKNISRKKVFIQDTIAKPLSYKQKEQEYYKKEIEKKVKKIKFLMASFSNLSSNQTLKASDKDNIEQIKILFETFETAIKKEQLEQTSLDKTIEILDKIYNLAPEIHIEQEQEDKIFYLPLVPREIFPEIKANFDELESCFNNSCYRSTLILCGKILEIVLHRKYFEVTGKDLLEKSPDIGLGNLIAKMKEKGLSLDPGLTQQIHLINQLRVFSVHKKGQTFVPSKAQAHATILYTLDVVKKLFKT